MLMKRTSLKILYILLILQFFGIANVVNASILPDVTGLGLSGDMEGMALKLTNWLLGFGLSFSVIALIWGGINYIGSSGDAQKSELAKKIIYYAIMGVVVIGLAFSIVVVIRGLFS